MEVATFYIVKPARRLCRPPEKSFVRGIVLAPRES